MGLAHGHDQAAENPRSPNAEMIVSSSSMLGCLVSQADLESLSPEWTPNLRGRARRKALRGKQDGEPAP